MSTSNRELVSWVCAQRFPSFLAILCSPAANQAHVLAGVGCGLWHPEADPLALLRENIDENAQSWKDVLRAPAMRREFLNGAPDDDDAVVKAFAHHNRESALKTKPKVWIFLCPLPEAQVLPVVCPFFE